MSFTAEVRDELARCEPECEYCDLSTLAALTRVSGTLSLAGSGRYRLTVATETGAVARTMITLTHRILKLKTEFTVRKSVLHKVRNYLITLPDQPDLDKALVLLGILDRRGGLVAGVPRHIVARPCCRLAYIRGALIAGGFVADPRGDFHLEIAVQGEQYARGLCDLLEQIGVHARVNARRGSFAVYIKSAEEIEQLLKLVGAKRWFIMKPFLVTSVLQGIYAGLISWAMLAVMIVGLSEGLPEVNFVGEHAYIAAICGVLMVGGILISLVFTSFAVRKFLRMNTSNANLY